MVRLNPNSCAVVLMLLATTPASAEQFVVKLETSVQNGSIALQDSLKIEEVERFESQGVNFLVLDAESEAHLEAYLLATRNVPISISEVDFINSPVVGGGDPAPVQAKENHQTFIIERPIQGVGDFPLAKKEAISRASIAAMEQLEGKVEWAHSYLTDAGTVCVYRATDESQIVKHADLAGAPLGPITLVEQILTD